MLRQQLSDTEEDHTYWLEKQLRLIELIGLLLSIVISALCFCD